MLATLASSNSRLSQAVEDCLRACHQSDRPFLALAAEIERLKAAGRLGEVEVLEVERATIAILRAVMDPEWLSCGRPAWYAADQSP